MKGIENCAECAYYSMKTHKCSRGAKIDPELSKGDDVRYFADCPLCDVEPVRHGRWIPHAAYEEYDIAYCDYVCSECGHEITKRLLCVPPRCENCGARMDGDEE